MNTLVRRIDHTKCKHDDTATAKRHCRESKVQAAVAREARRVTKEEYIDPDSGEALLDRAFVDKKGDVLLRPESKRVAARRKARDDEGLVERAFPDEPVQTKRSKRVAAKRSRRPVTSNAVVEVPAPVMQGIAIDTLGSIIASLESVTDALTGHAALTAAAVQLQVDNVSVRAIHDGSMWSIDLTETTA